MTKIVNLVKWMEKVTEETGGDLAKFGKKRNTDYDHHPPLFGRKITLHHYNKANSSLIVEIG